VFPDELEQERASFAAQYQPVVPVHFHPTSVRGNVADYPQDTRLFAVEQISIEDAMARKILLIVLVQVSRQINVKHLGQHLSARFPNTEVLPLLVICVSSTSLRVGVVVCRSRIHCCRHSSSSHPTSQMFPRTGLRTWSSVICKTTRFRRH